MQKQLNRRCRALVVDDEINVREVATLLLERLGVQVSPADGARDAHRILAMGGEPFEVTFVDVSLTDGRCEDVMREVVGVHDRCELVAMSGYDVSHAPRIPGRRVRFLQKPFTLEMLRRLLEEMGFGEDSRSAP